MHERDIVSDKPIKTVPISRNRKTNGARKIDDTLNNPYLKNVVGIKYDKYAQYITKFTITLIVMMSVFSGLKNDSISTFFLILTLFGFAYFLTYRLFIRAYSKIRSTILLTIIPVIVSIVIFSPNGTAETSSSSPSPSANFSDSKYCAKHDRMYNPENAWKGCPECVEEQDQKNLGVYRLE